jgi:hypothetical protein
MITQASFGWAAKPQQRDYHFAKLPHTPATALGNT